MPVGDEAEDEWVCNRDVDSGVSDGGGRGWVMKMIVGAFGCHGVFLLHRSLGTGTS